MGRLVKTTPAAQEQQEEKRTVVGTGAHGRLVKTGDVQRTSPAANTAKTPTAQSVYQKVLDEAMMKRAAADQKNKERGRKSYNRTHAQEVREITGDKTKKSITPIIKSAAAGYAADMVGAADTLLRAPSGLNYAASQERGEIEASKKNIAAYTEKLKAAKTEEERQHWQTLIDRNKRLIEINSKAAGEQVKNYQDATKGAQETLQGTYQKLRKTASDNMEKANEGLTPVGKYLNNVGVAGAQMVADATLGGGSALGPMFLRVFGGNSQEAAEAADKPGMSAAEQLDAQNRALLYGTASGAVSIATEKISNVAAPFKKAFGGGFLDKAIDGAIAKMNGNAAGRLALSFLSEGGEEVIEDIVQPALQTIYNGKSAGQNYSELDAAEILNDFLVGGTLGLLGSGVEGIQRRSAQIETERAAAETKEATPSPEETAPTAQRPAQQQNTMPAQPAATPESAQGTGGGNLTPTQPNAAQGAAEGKADALDAGKRVNLLEYSNEQNAQKVEDGLKDGTLAVDAKENIYRVNEDQHIDRRDSASVGERSVNAFQFDHPELHGYYADAAAVLQEEMSFAQKGGELIRRTSREAGDDEYIRTKRGVSERITRLLDDEGVRYDDIDRSLSAIIHNHGQENFAAAKRVELLLDDMLTNGYTDIHGQHIAPNEEYIAAKKAIPGADMSERTHEELPIYDMPEGRNGGIDNAGQETRNHVGGAEFANTAKRGTPEAADAASALPDGAAERGERERGGRESGRIPREVRNVGGEDGNALTVQQRLAASGISQFISPREANVPNGASGDNTVTIFDEADWDQELIGAADWAKSKGVKKVTALLGVIKVEKDGKTGRIFGAFNADTGEIFVNAGSVQRSVSETIEHETAHYLAEVARRENVRTFMRDVQSRYSSEEWGKVYDAYFERYAALTDNYAGMSESDIELYVWEEIMGDAYAEIDQYDEKASRFNREAESALSQSGQESESVLQSERTPGAVEQGRETAAATERRTGPPEKFSVLEEVEGENGTYGKGVMLDTNLFDGIRPRDWGKTLGRYVYNNMAGMELTAYDAAGKPETIYLARTNDRVQKDGAKNSHKVIDKLARSTGDNIRSLAVVHLDEALTTSRYENSTDEHNHQWMDENGWEHRKTYLQDRSGNIYEATLNIADGRDRKILYDINNIRLVDKAKSPDKHTAAEAKAGEITGGAVPSAVTGGARSTSRNFFEKRIADRGGNVKSPTLGDETRQQIMGEETEPFKTGESSAKDVDTGGAASSAESVSENGGNVKPKTRFSLEDETDSAGRELTMQQREYFKDSEVRDEDGRLIPVYHGSQTQFTEFSADFMSMHGSMEGQGFYFTDNRSMAEGYKRDGGQLLEGYLNISKPLSDSEVTMTKAELKKLLKAVDPTGDDVVINYDPTGGMGYPSKAWYNRALAATVEQIYSTSDSDSEILADVANSGAGAGATTKAARRALGYDGYIVKGKYDDATVYVAFESNQFKNADNKTPTDDPDIRFSAEDEDGGEWDKELARMPQSVQEAVRRVKDERSKKPSMQEFPNLDAYLSGRSAQQAAEKAERLRDKGKDEFKGTEALEKLGVKIENSAGDYSNVEQLIANDRAAKTIQRETRKAIKRLGATPKEQNFALNIASGLYDEADIPATMNRGKVVELADYYSAEQSMSTDFIRQRRAEINDRLQEKMKDLFDEHFDGEFTKEKSGKGISPESGFALYHRTPQRSMRAIFGWKRGEKINEAIFEPVYVNEQERKRFVNRMHDEVRTFKGEDGKEEALTQRERALAQLSIEGKAVEEMVGKSEIKQQIIHAAENLLDGAEMKDTAQEFGLHGKEERELAQRYADWLETKRELDSGEVDRVRVENAAAKYSGLYNEFYAAINDFLVAHGYEPIGFIKGYAPHFQPEAESGKLERALKAIGVDLGAEVGKLPASIAGLTKEFKPNKRYNPFFQHRNGKSTDYDIQKGFEKYVDYLSDVLYHTDDIMRTRAASKYFRKKYAPDEISAQIQQAEDLKFATAEEKELFLKTNGIIDSSTKMSYQAMNQAMEKYTDSLFDDVTQTTKYGDLVTWLDDYANKLAGKQLFNDRSMEREVGRMSLNVGRKLVSTFARANVAGNLSSALNQTAQLPMIAGELGPKYVAEAIGDITSGKARGDFADRSDFLTEKRGIRYLTSTKGDKFTAALFWPLERMDYLVSSIAVRGKYRKELAEGKSEKDALRAADRWGRDMMGSRSKGTAPLTFQSKNLISQMVNLFQVEALNSWEHVTQDLFGPGLREMEEKLGKKEASRRLAGIIVGTLLGAFILNRVDEELYGGTPAQFDVLGLLTGFLASGNGLSTNEQLGVWVDDVWQKMTGERLFGTDEDAGNDEFNLAAAAEDTIYNVSNDVPYVRNVSGLLGLGDQTLPMPDIYSTAKGIGSAVSDAASGDTEGFGSEIMRQLMGLVGDTVPGGRQVEKSVQGAGVIKNGGLYKGSGENKRLQYPAKPFLEDPWEALRAGLFGRNALSEARDFYAANDGGLSASQTRTYQELVDMGADREVIYDAIQKWRKIDKDDSLTDGEREAAQFELVRKLKLTNEQKERLHDDLSRSSRSYAAAQEAQKQGISAETYAEYKDATADLTADKDENGKAINGSKKAKVLDAIDKMQLSKKQKDWLYLDAGYSEKDIGKAPWNS